MQTNFFQNIESLNVQGGWKINIAPDKEGKVTVSVLFFDDRCGDDARKLIPPMIFRGTPKEIDEAFFSEIEAPVKVTAKLFVNMEAYMKAQEEAMKQSKMEQAKKSEVKKQADEKEKKFQAQMKKVAELETQSKFGEAISQLPKTEDYPEKETAINQKKEELWKKRTEKEQTLF